MEYNQMTPQQDTRAIELVQAIFTKAALVRASDVHIDPTPESVKIRFRIDGVMQDQGVLPPQDHDLILMRLKVLSNLDITARPLPQDGHFELKTQPIALPTDMRGVSGTEKVVQEVDPNKQFQPNMLDIRISIFPTIYGEAAVCRLLNRSDIAFSLKDLGLDEETLKKVLTMISKNYGMVLVTGPVGAGKTTALYSILQEIMGNEKIAVTLEDPVEFRFGTVRQIQVQPERGLTFGVGMKSILRQDPDIILIGEIRDNETAEHAVRASLTGRTVFSTIHSNTSIGTVARLLDMSVERSLIAYALNGVISTRLVRKNCSHCAVPYEPSAEYLKFFDISPGHHEFKKGKGCERCKGTGFAGRTGIFEVLEFGEDLRSMIIDHASMAELQAFVEKNGMKTLKRDALEKAMHGVTPLEHAAHMV